MRKQRTATGGGSRPGSSRRWAATLVAVFALGEWSVASQPPVSAEQIVAQCAKAMGGMEKIEALQTLRVAVVYPDHGTTPIFCEIRRPNMIRTRITVFDGKHGCLTGDPSGAAGTSFRPKLIPAEEVKDFEIDIAWLVPAFFDYPSEYLGTEVADGATMHKLAVSLPLGAKIVYFVDSETSLVHRAFSEVVMDGKVYRMERTFSDFRPAGGILFPRTFVYPGRHEGTQTATVASIDVNIPLSEDDFKIPADVQE